MVEESKKLYKSHRAGHNFDSFINVLNDRSNLDRYYMGHMLRPSIDYLYKNGVVDYQDFSKLFKKYKLKSQDIIRFIQSFECHVNSQENYNKITWIRTRELKKTNFNEKNIILNRFVLEYQNIFIYYFINYFQTYHPNIQNYMMLRKEFEFGVDCILQQVKKTKVDKKQENFNNMKDIKTKVQGNYIVSSHCVKKITILK